MQARAIKDLANTALRSLEERLLQLQQEDAATEKIESEIADYFQKAFDQIKTVIDIKRLTTQLSLSVHPDKLNGQLKAEVVAYLTQKGLIEAPFRILEDKKDKLLTLKKLNFAELPPLVRNLLLRPIVLMVALYENLGRYVRPLRFLTRAISVLTAGIAGIGVFLFYACGLIIFSSIRFCLDGLINIYTSGLLNKKCENYRKEKVDDAVKATYLDGMRVEYQVNNFDLDILSMDDDTLLDFMRGQLIEADVISDDKDIDYVREEYVNKPAEKLVVIGRAARLKLVAVSLYESLMQLPKGTIIKIFFIFTWPLQLLLIACPLFALAAAIEFTNFLLDISLSAVVVPGLLVTVSTFVAFNIPLLIWDAPGYLLTKIKNAWKGLPDSGPDKGLGKTSLRTTATLMLEHKKEDEEEMGLTGQQPISLIPSPSCSPRSVNGNETREEKSSSPTSPSVTSFSFIPEKGNSSILPLLEPVVPLKEGTDLRA